MCIYQSEGKTNESISKKLYSYYLIQNNLIIDITKEILNFFCLIAIEF